MKTMNRTHLKVTGLLALIISVGTATSGHAQTLLLSLQASNYNATTGIWTDSSPNGDNAQVNSGTTTPTLVTNATPNGSSAVLFTGTSVFDLLNSLSSSSGFTAFVYAEPTSTADGSFVGGVQGGFQYRVVNGKQDVVRQAQSDLGAGTATVSTSSFSLFDVTSSSSGTSYRLNGSSDGTGSGSSFAGISTIGSNQDGLGGELFKGDIADIEIYSGVLTSQQIMTEEAALTTKYVTATPEPSTWALLLGGIGSLALLRRFRRFGQV